MSDWTTGFMLIQANRMESLRGLLSAWLRRHPLHPLDNEAILVQSNGIRRLINLQPMRPAVADVESTHERFSRYSQRTRNSIPSLSSQGNSTMRDLLQSALTAIPEDFFHRLEERMTICTATAYEQAARTPPETPAHRMRLGTTRYFERGEAFRLSAEDVGMRYRYEQVNTHAFALATSGHFLITHAKVDHWGDPIEQKEYKQALARHNPSDSEPLPLPPTADPANPLLAIVVVLYARPGTGQDETLPMRLGFGIPTRDLRGWHLLKTLDQLFAAYADLHHRPFDHARPQLRAQQEQAEHTDPTDRPAARSRLHHG